MQITCLNCKKIFNSRLKKRKYCCQKCYLYSNKNGLIGKSFKWPSNQMEKHLNPNWNGGSSWEYFHKYSVKLLGDKCEFCRSTKFVQTHHIDHNTKNNPLDCTNWIRLCSKCHMNLHIGKAKRLLNYMAIKIAFTRKIKA